MLPLTLILANTLLTVIPASSSCIEPTGLGNGVGEIDAASLALPEPSLYMIFAMFINDDLSLHETPVQFRISHIGAISIFNALSGYDSTSFDFFARDPEILGRRMCQDTLSAEDFRLHRRLTLAYTCYYTWREALWFSDANIQGLLATWGLDATICDASNPNSDLYDCSDLSTPWGLAYTVSQEILSATERDGWNADGSLSRDFNKIPYQNFLNKEEYGEDAYEPVNTPYNLRIKNQWQPLLETDNLGYITYQEHVTSHIGLTAKSYFLDEDTFCDWATDKSRVNNPRYDYEDEIDLLLQRLANLSDTTKMEIEYFDSKAGSLVTQQIRYSLYSGIDLDSFEFATLDLIGSSVLYEAGLLVWHSKLRWDRVRPPSIIHELRGDEEITTYAGTTRDGESYGTQTFLGRDFESYKRTMPHSEYPSGSACVCEAFALAMREYTGTDSIISQLGVELSETFEPLSSSVEPRSTPSESVTLSFGSWSEVSERCGESRLNGGMHFTESVPAGQRLCQDVGPLVVNTINAITSGEQPDYVADIDDDEIKVREC